MTEAWHRSRRRLQAGTAILASVPITTGLIGFAGLADPLYGTTHSTAAVLLDSNLRFFAGLWLGLGLAVAWLVPAIERHTTLFRVLWGMIFLGGLGRLLSLLLVAAPPLPFVFFTLLELAGAPLFVAWQARLAARAG